MIRWINQWLGTCAYDRRGPGDYALIDVRDLVDKGGNSSAAIVASIEAGAAARKAGRKVVVACDFGVSRSNSVAAGILSVVENCSLDSAVANVIAATGELEIKLEMVQSVREALGDSVRNEEADRVETVLVTGGSGFLGRNLVPRLRQSCRVVAPSRHILNLSDGAVKLATYCRAEGVTQIVHLAYPRIYTNVAAMADGMAMLRTILDTCKLLDIRLIFISGAVVFGGYKSSALIADEVMPLRPKGAYSDAKYLEEILVDAYFQRGDVRRTVCRLSGVYGPGGERPRLINAFAEKLANGERVRTHRYKNGHPALDLLYISDSVEAIARSVAWPHDEVFHFGSGRLYTTSEIAEQIAAVLGVPCDTEAVAISDSIANVQLDYGKSERTLKWSPKVSLAEGLSECLRPHSKAAAGGQG